VSLEDDEGDQSIEAPAPPESPPPNVGKGSGEGSGSEIGVHSEVPGRSASGIGILPAVVS